MAATSGRRQGHSDGSTDVYNDSPALVSAVYLKHRFGDVDADCCNRLHIGSLKSWALNSIHIHGTHVPVEERSTTLIPDLTLRSDFQAIVPRGCLISSRIKVCAPSKDHSACGVQTGSIASPASTLVSESDSIRQPSSLGIAGK